MALGKKEIRRNMLARRRTLTPSDALEMSWAAQGNVMSMKSWATAREVLLYMHARGEVMTDTLVGDALARSIRVLLPRCRPGQPGMLDMCCIPHLGEVQPGAYDILEPSPDTCPALKACAPNMAVLPGVAFDRRGYRLGHGAGYYDRFLAGHGAADLSETLLVGLCYSFQLVDKLPRENWDKPVTVIVTEEDILWT